MKHISISALEYADGALAECGHVFPLDTQALLRSMLALAFTAGSGDGIGRAQEILSGAHNDA